MKLLHSALSPFARKVRAAAALLGLADRIELVAVDTGQSPEALTQANPLCKIPALLLEDGRAIFDSPVICEYLATLGEPGRLIPEAGPARIEVLQLQATGDGICDAAVLRRTLGVNGIAPDNNLVLRQKAAMARMLDRLEETVPPLLPDLGTIAVACALAYLDTRFADEPWREARPQLAAWYDAISREDCLRSLA